MLVAMVVDYNYVILLGPRSSSTVGGGILEKLK